VAKQIWTNIDQNIRYVYFFEANSDAADKIPQLLQLLCCQCNSAGAFDVNGAIGLSSRLGQNAD